MTNEQKYKTAEERIKAFLSQREVSSIATVIANEFAHWLALEVEEEPDPCPFCGGKCSAETVKSEDLETGEVCSWISVLCYGKDGVGCGYQSKFFVEEADAVAAHNSVCRAVEAMKK